jgi:hypothetical protein
MTESAGPMDKAIRNLGLCHTIRYGERILIVACLIREAELETLESALVASKGSLYYRR